MLNSEIIIKQLKDNENKIKVYHVEKIGLFGSYISGNANEESDIDILVEFSSGQKKFDNYMELKFYLEDLFGKKIDLVILEALKPRLKEKILNEVKYA